VKVTLHRKPDRRHPEAREGGVPIAEILRQHNISKATYFHWRVKYAGASVDELKRLRDLEAENAKPKRM